MKKEKTKKDLIVDQIIESNTMVTAKDVSNVLDDLYSNIVQRLLLLLHKSAQIRKLSLKNCPSTHKASRIFRGFFVFAFS